MKNRAERFGWSRCRLIECFAFLLSSRLLHRMQITVRRRSIWQSDLSNDIIFSYSHHRTFLLSKNCYVSRMESHSHAQCQTHFKLWTFSSMNTGRKLAPFFSVSPRSLESAENLGMIVESMRYSSSIDTDNWYRLKWRESAWIAFDSQVKIENIQIWVRWDDWITHQQCES